LQVNTVTLNVRQAANAPAIFFVTLEIAKKFCIVNNWRGLESVCRRGVWHGYWLDRQPVWLAAMSQIAACSDSSEWILSICRRKEDK